MTNRTSADRARILERIEVRAAQRHRLYLPNLIDAGREPIIRPLAEEAQCCTWDTGEVHGLCRIVRCKHCTLFPPDGPLCPDGHPTERCSEPDNVFCPTCDTYYDPRELD